MTECFASGHKGNPCQDCGIRRCNRHDDCDQADRNFKLQYPNGKTVRGCGIPITRVDHCDDECCEDCFGS